MTQEEFIERYNYESAELINEGGFGTVFKAFDSKRNRYVAIKESEVSEKHKFSLRREVELSNELEPHPNISRYENTYRFKPIRKEIDYAIMKYYSEGNLKNVIDQNNLTLKEKHEIIKAILKGIQYLHHEKIIHRDLKPQNILMDKKDGAFIPVIADFGLSRMLSVDEYSIKDSAVGMSIAYAAPEQLLNQKIKSNVDLWAVGVIVFQMMTGHLPFKVVNGKNPIGIIDVFNKMTQGITEAQIQDIVEPFQSIIRKCLVIDPSERIQTAKELLAVLNNEPIDENDKEENQINTAKDEKTTLKVEPNKSITPIPISPKVKQRSRNIRLALGVSGMIAISLIVLYIKLFPLQLSLAPNEFRDERDNKVYQTTEVGNLLWMTKNLNYKADNSTCYKDDLFNCKKFGKLYTWKEAKEACPDGWRLPTDKEWKQALTNIGGYVNLVPSSKKYGDGGRKAEEELKLIYGGLKNIENAYIFKDESGHYWSSTSDNASLGWYYKVTNKRVYRASSNKGNAFSCRCVKEK